MSSSNTRLRTTILSLTGLRNQLEQTATTLEQTATTLGNRATTLEQTASILSFDTLVGVPTPVNSFSIPFDLSDNESVEINITLKLFGTGNTSLFIRSNSAASQNRAWDDWIGFWWEPIGTAAPTVSWVRTSQEGLTLIFAEQSTRTAKIRFKMYRSFDSGTSSGLYIAEVLSVYRRVGFGISKSDMTGAVSTYIPNGITVSVSASQTMSASYSIIQDRRRTVLNGTLL